MGPERALLALGAVSGCLGVALAAAAAHGPGGTSLETSSRFLLMHAPALIGLAAASAAGLGQRALTVLAGALLALGLALFSGDLAYRAFRSAALFPTAAPIGGLLLMGGWALVAVAAVMGGRKRL